MDSLSIASLMSSLLAGGTTSLLALAAFPLGVLIIAWLLNRADQTAASQLVANAGIAFGLGAVLAMICSLVVASGRGVDIWADVGVPWLLIPFYLVVAGFFVENWVHPGRQESIRTKIRRGAAVVIVLSVVFWLMWRMQIFMVVLTNVLGLLLFLAAIMGILYYMVRKVV